MRKLLDLVGGEMGQSWTMVFFGFPPELLRDLGKVLLLQSFNMLFSGNNFASVSTPTSFFSPCIPSGVGGGVLTIVTLNLPLPPFPFGGELLPPAA